MNRTTPRIGRRTLVAGAAGLAAAAPFARIGAAESDAVLTRPIPATGERIPAVGMGSWITFNVGEDRALRDQRTEVLRTFFELGGGMIDSSPMYGSSEAAIGYGLRKLGHPEGLVSATKVWTRLPLSDGEEQMVASRELWGIEAFDVMQVHNLVEWREHLKTLRADKEAGRIRYIGITTSHGSRHDELERIMRSEPLDFVQFTYNIGDRWAEDRLLPLAADRGLGVIVNRPFRRKQLIRMYEDRPLPPWAEEAGAANWPQFLLKFIVSHPAVTCAVPATSRVDHMAENMGALRGPLPDARMRRRMVEYVEGL